MKKVFFSLLLLAVTMFMTTSAFAAVTGPCVNCHSMHNSQNGADLGGPNGVLLTDSCVACHTTGGSGPEVISTAVTAPTGPGNPNYLAGGNFWWVDTGADDTKGHNVLGVAGLDTTGVSGGLIPPGGTGLATQLTCAGTLGCHGTSGEAAPLNAISGAHHGNIDLAAGSATGTTPADSYRFLVGIRGIEDDDYEETVTASDHNGYSGSTGVDASTISSLCASCHTDFHGASTSSGSTWIRHPTDLDLSTALGEYTAYATYNPLVPVGSTTNADLVNTDVQTAGKGIVTCLSCHRAHGSEFPDMLRYAYDMSAGIGTQTNEGCFVCHSSKDGVVGNGVL